MAQGFETHRIAERYDLLELIGSGGFGETWRAHDELLDIDVAIKLYRNSDATQRERYLREARSLARWSHQDGIASVRDLIIAGDQVCLVMDYVAGIDLSVIIGRNNGLDVETTLLILKPVAQALSTMHEAGLVHRDVSPENIRVQGDGKGVLLDFGSVLSASDAARTTVMVKPGYAPPEQYGDSASQGPWTDVYALAATAYHCLVGEAPMDSLQRTFADELERPSAMGVALPWAAEDALMSGLELDYHDRMQAVDELMRGLEGGTTTQEASPEPVVPAKQHDTALIEETKPKPEPTPATPSESNQDASNEKPARERKRKAQHTKKRRQPKKRESAKRSPSKKSRAASGKSRRLIAIVAALVVVALIGGALMLMRGTGAGGILGGKSQYTSDYGSAYLSDMLITDDIAEELAGDPTLTDLALTRCSITNEQIKTIAQNEHVQYWTFFACQGFTSLEPLAGMENLYTITVTQMAKVDLQKLLPVTFENVNILQLRKLEISNQGDALTHFPTVHMLDLQACTGIGDLSFLEDCPNLSNLTLSGTDLSQGGSEHLKDVPSLTVLNANRCKMEDLSWVSSCPNLQGLSAMENNISDISPLAGCENLRTLRLSNNNISDVSALASCSRLDIVCLDQNQLSDLSGIKGCGKITLLKVNNNKLTNLDFCEELINLAFLDASHNEITDISKLTTCAKCEGVFLQVNKIKDLDALANGFTSLSVLNIAENEVSSLEPLSACSALAHVVINDNQITSLKGLEDKPLESLLASKNQIEDISALEGSASKLTSVDLGYNKISDISALSGMAPGGIDVAPAVQVLLDHNQIKSIDPLPNAKYRALALFDNPIEDFNALNGSKWDSYSLYIPYTEGADYDVLSDLSRLLEVHLVGVPYDKQVAIERAAENEDSSLGAKVRFSTEDEANAGIQDVRDKLNEEVSGIQSPEDEEQ